MQVVAEPVMTAVATMGQLLRSEGVEELMVLAIMEAMGALAAAVEELVSMVLDMEEPVVSVEAVGVMEEPVVLVK